MCGSAAKKYVAKVLFRCPLANAARRDEMLPLVGGEGKMLIGMIKK